MFTRKISAQGLMVFAVVALAAALRVMDITTLSLWQDEAVSWKQSNRSFWDMLVQTSHDNYPPLHNIILNLVTRYFGDSEILLRLPSVILGTLAVYVTYRIGAAISGFKTGLIAAILLTFSVFHIWYSTEVRMYALLSCTSAVFFLYSYRMVRGKAVDGALALAGLALLYSHVYGAINFLAINLSVLALFFIDKRIGRDQIRIWFKNQIIAVALFLPWLAILVMRSLSPNTSGFGWLPRPDASFVLQHVSTLFGGGPTFAILGIFAAIAVIGARQATKTQNIAVFMLVIWLIMPILIGLTLSLLYQPMFYDRYLIAALVPMMVLAAIGMQRIKLPRPYLIAGGFMLFIALAPGRQNMAQPYFRHDVRPDMAQFAALHQENDIVFFLEWEVPLFLYYAPKPLDVTPKRQDELPSDNDLPERFWVIEWTGNRAQDGLVDHLESLGYSMRYRSKTKDLFALFVKKPRA